MPIGGAKQDAIFWEQLVCEMMLVCLARQLAIYYYLNDSVISNPEP